jgi:hypothetical protein
MRAAISELYVRMQNCWTAKDLTPLRPYLTDELYARSDRQLDGYRSRNETPNVDRIEVTSVDIRGWYNASGNDHLIIELSANVRLYTTNDATGSIVKGSMNEMKRMTYEWDMVRTEGVKTGEAPVKEIECPNCGAPVSINRTADCPYCGAVITVNEHGWVLSGIKGLSQRTYRIE